LTIQKLKREYRKRFQKYLMFKRAFKRTQFRVVTGMIIRFEAIVTIVANVQSKANSFMLPRFAVRTVSMGISGTLLGGVASLLAVIHRRFWWGVRFFTRERSKFGVIARGIVGFKAGAVVVTNVKTEAHRLIGRNLAVRAILRFSAVPVGVAGLLAVILRRLVLGWASVQIDWLAHFNGLVRMLKSVVTHKWLQLRVIARRIIGCET